MAFVYVIVFAINKLEAHKSGTFSFFRGWNGFWLGGPRCVTECASVLFAEPGTLASKVIGIDSHLFFVRDLVRSIWH